MGIKFLEPLKDAQNSKPATTATPPEKEQPKNTSAVSDSSGNGNKPQEASTDYVNNVLNSSVFDDQNTTAAQSVRKNSNQTQEQILQKLKDAGIKTTKIHYEKGETDFAQYTAALDDELKKAIVDSFDCEADYILQQEILSLFQEKHSMGTGTFKSTLAKMGYTISVDKVKTGLLTDWKADVGSNYERHTIQLISIKDPKTGAEIKIADTNGNGYIEVEEVVANEFLTGIAAQIDISNLKNAPSASGSIASSSGELGNYTTASANGTEAFTNQAERIQQETSAQNGKQRLSEQQYKILKEKLIKRFINKGYSETEASAKALSYLQERYMISEGAKSIGDLEKIAQAVAA